MGALNASTLNLFNSRVKNLPLNKRSRKLAVGLCSHRFSWLTVSIYCVHSINHRMSQLHGAAKVTNDSINTSSNSERAKREENGLKVKLVVI